MKKTLIDLWYGNVDPRQDAQANQPIISDLMHLIERNRTDLNRTLNNDQKEIFEKYEGCADELSELCERNYFIYGFRLGMRLAVEALAEEDDQNDT
jgi:hypothetical protein